MNIKLDLRLKTIANYISDNKNIVDVGTDHGYLPIYIALNKKPSNIIACDINKKPLQKAIDNIKKYSLDEKIQVVLSDGLKSIPKDKADEIIIAGMGGELIAKIINETPWIDKKTLILQPMSKIEYIRNFLYDINFEIIKETPILHNNKFYSVILTKKTSKIKYKKDDVYIKLGRTILCKNDYNNIYRKYQCEKIERIIYNLKNSKYIDKHKINSLNLILENLNKIN